MPKQRIFVGDVRKCVNRDRGRLKPSFHRPLIEGLNILQDVLKLDSRL